MNQTEKRNNMNYEQLVKILSDSLMEIMEAMAFMFVAPAPKGDTLLVDGNYLQSKIEFWGEIEGSIKISAEEALCIELASNILGMEPQDPDCADKAKDALKETVNTVCGRFLTNAAGNEPLFKLSTPTIRSITLEQMKEIYANEHSCLLAVEQHPILIELIINKVHT